MTSNNRTVLVAGATGRQGGATTRRLLADGWAVRALVRDAGAEAALAVAAAGAELVTGDLDDPDSVARAVTDVHGVFFAPPAGFGAGGLDPNREFVHSRTLIDAAVAAGVAHLVFSGVASVTGPSEQLATGKSRAEAHLRASGLTWTVLRPVRFLTNYLGTGLPIDGFQDGVSRHIFAGDRPMQVVAVEDIAAFAALALADPDRYAGRTLELAGDDPTPEAAVAAIGAATGLSLRYVRMSREEAERIGVEVARVRDLQEAGHGWHADIEALRVLHPGLLTLQDWLDRGGAEQIRKQVTGS